MILNMNKLRQTCRIRNPIVRECVAEFIGTVTLVFVGDAAIANHLSNPSAAAINVPLGYATALALAVFVAGGVSGGHVNPTVTLGLCLTGRCDLNRLLPFTIVQFIGGFVGAALTHGLFFDRFNHDDPDRELFASVFATYPNGEISTGGAVLDQILGTALLLFGILAVTDRRNMQVPKGGIPMAVAMVLFGVITATGSNTGAALNPARDLSPRLYSLIIGYDDAFNDPMHFWWIPIVGCYVGAAIGSFVYFFFIDVHHAPETDEEEKLLEMKPSAAPAARPDRTRNGREYEPESRGAEMAYPRQARNNRGYEPDVAPERAYPKNGRNQRGYESEGYM